MVKIILVALLLSGCSTKYIIITEEPPIVTRPELPVLSLKEGDEPDVVVRAYRETILRLQSWGLELETILDGYRRKSTK